ncbi:MAG: zf-HC2 domain-containing protein [Clostridia bacterium]
MQCNKYRILIHKQLDGRATELEIRQLRQHLDTCPNCSRYQEETTALMESLRLTPLPAPPGLQACVAQRIQNQRREPSSRKPSLQQGFCWGAVVSRPAVSSSFSFSWASIFFPFLPTFMNIYRCSSAIFCIP